MDISMVTSFYNGYDKYLETWLDKILESTALPDEIVIVVSGDTYSEENIAKAEKMLNGIVEYQIVYIEKHVCMGQARNDGVRVATSEWILYLNVDDHITSNAIKDIRDNLSDDIDVLIGSMDWINHPKWSGVHTYDISRESLLVGGWTNDHSTYRKSMWEKSNYIEYSGDVDVAFWTGLAQEGARIKCIPEVLSIHYFRPDTVYGRYSKQDKKEIKRMRTIWLKEGVHSKRFEAAEYRPTGEDINFRHRTEVEV